MQDAEKIATSEAPVGAIAYLKFERLEDYLDELKRREINQTRLEMTSRASGNGDYAMHYFLAIATAIDRNAILFYPHYLAKVSALQLQVERNQNPNSNLPSFVLATESFEQFKNSLPAHLTILPGTWTSDPPQLV